MTLIGSCPQSYNDGVGGQLTGGYYVLVNERKKKLCFYSNSGKICQYKLLKPACLVLVRIVLVNVKTTSLFCLLYKGGAWKLGYMYC